MQLNLEKYSKYLPSKKFILITSIIIILGIIIFTIFFMSSKGENFSITGEKNVLPLKIENQTITELIKNDTDGDGIVDWEEALWGTDKNKKMTFNDTPDAIYIENKKAELKTEQKIIIDETKLTETEKFARQFFSSYNAMKSSGQVDDETINSFSSALGQKIVNPSLVDSYKNTDIKINKNDDTIAKQTYYMNMKDLFEIYKSEGIGNELNIVSGEVANSQTQKTEQNEELTIIANAYQDFAKKIMELEVPNSLAKYHLQITNSANNTGISVLNMGKMIADPIVGLSGLSQYQKYSEDLIKAVGDLEKVLSTQ